MKVGGVGGYWNPHPADDDGWRPKENVINYQEIRHFMEKIVLSIQDVFDRQLRKIDPELAPPRNSKLFAGLLDIQRRQN